MAKAPPSFQFYPGDFMAGTAHLDAEAIGCYLLLLCFQWMHGSVPNERAQMARICKKTAPEFESIWHLIEDKFAVSECGGLVNERMESIRTKAVRLSEKRSEIGRLGGKANASDLLKQKQSKGRLKTEDRKLNIKSKKISLITREGVFEQWWRHYPRKAAKAAAAKAYEKAVDRLGGRESDPDGFLWARVRAFAESDVGKGDYCPYPATWLNQERYDDDPSTWQRGSPPNGKPRPEPFDAAKIMGLTK